MLLLVWLSISVLPYQLEELGHDVQSSGPLAQVFILLGDDNFRVFWLRTMGPGWGGSISRELKRRETPCQPSTWKRRESVKEDTTRVHTCMHVGVFLFCQVDSLILGKKDRKKKKSLYAATIYHPYLLSFLEAVANDDRKALRR